MSPVAPLSMSMCMSMNHFSGSAYGPPCSRRYRSRNSSSSPTARRSLLGEYVAEAQVVGQIKQRHLMSQVGPHALVPPTSYGCMDRTHGGRVFGDMVDTFEYVRHRA